MDTPKYETEEEKKKRVNKNILSISSGLTLLGLGIFVNRRVERAPQGKIEDNETKKKRQRKNLPKRIIGSILIISGAVIPVSSISTLNEDGTIR